MPQVNPYNKVDDYVKLVNKFMKGLTEKEYLEFLYPMIALRWMEIEGILRSSVIQISSKGYKDSTGNEYLNIYNMFNSKVSKLPKKTNAVSAKDVEFKEIKKILEFLSSKLSLPSNCNEHIDFRNWVGHGAYYDFDLTKVKKEDYSNLTRLASLAKSKMESL